MSHFPSFMSRPPGRAWVGRPGGSTPPQTLSDCGGNAYSAADLSQGAGPNTSGLSTCLDIPVIFSNSMTRLAGTWRRPLSQRDISACETPSMRPAAICERWPSGWVFRHFWIGCMRQILPPRYIWCNSLLPRWLTTHIANLVQWTYGEAIG